MSRKSTIDTLFVRKSDPGAVTPAGDKDRIRTGAISAMGTSLKELTEGARAAARLQEQIEAGGAVIDIEPALLDGSLVTDRLPIEVDPSFDALVESIRSSGQQVPILVRPYPEDPRRYQIAYGHRRMRAATRLGIKVKAIVRALTDAELVVAQGKENLDRHDLSYIEKALFARRLEDQGFDRAVIMAALSTEKGDLSRYISVARMMSERLLQVIGPASKVGRSRWIALSQRLAHSRADAIVQETIGSEKFSSLDSDARFKMLFEALTRRAPERAARFQTWTNCEGQKAARIERHANRTVVTIDEALVPKFGSYVVHRLDDLYQQFLEAEREEGIKNTET